MLHALRSTFCVSVCMCVCDCACMCLCACVFRLAYYHKNMSKVQRKTMSWPKSHN